MATAMALRPEAPPEVDTLADHLERLGNVPLERILMHPAPGTATEEDCLAVLEAPNKRLCELVDGTLVEKAMGQREAMLGGYVYRRIDEFLDDNDLGVVYPADAPFRILPRQVRLPDASFFSWDRIGGEIPKEPMPRRIPDLAAEVISENNTVKEMQRKLQDYFASGVRVVWVFYPKTETAEVYTSPTRKRRIPRDGILDGGKLLPGFSLPLKKLFPRVNRKKGSS
jgi:Uma2 family endonuclease